jgi:hypothetical protein
VARGQGDHAQARSAEEQAQRAREQADRLTKMIEERGDASA